MYVCMCVCMYVCLAAASSSTDTQITPGGACEHQKGGLKPILPTSLMGDVTASENAKVN